MRSLLLIIGLGLLCACSSILPHDIRMMQQRECLEDAIAARFMYIPAGTFVMGSRYAETTAQETEKKFFADEAPMHEVTITKGFWISSTEVTIAQFKRFVDETGYVTSAERKGESLGKYSVSTDASIRQIGQWVSGKQLNWRNPGGWQASGNHPVIHVSWEDADAFCRWLRNKTGNNYRLPTEAEWEYAAGGPKREMYSWGNVLPSQARGGNIADASFLHAYPNWKYPVLTEYDDGYPNTAPVASFAPNGFDLYDMTGNVWEWVSDYYSPSFYHESPASDPKGPQEAIPSPDSLTTRPKRVHRGGGFDWELPYLRVAKRRAAPEDFSAVNIGFRVARDSAMVRSQP